MNSKIVAFEQPIKSVSGNLMFLDGLRGLAAFYVMVGHARWLLWEGYADGFCHHPASYSLMDRSLMYFFSLFKYGHEAVLFFFVLSGFVIHLRYARRIAGQGMAAKFDWLAFVGRRARRLYPPLLAAMAVAMVLDTIGKSHGLSIYHQATPYPEINANVVSHLDGVTALGNLAFVMNTYVPVFGCNGPLWSLKFEWWFYMIYPLFWWLSRRSIVMATGLMAALFAASYFPSGWPLQLLRDVFGAMLAWWLGALLADIFAGRIKWRWHWVALATALSGLLALGFGGPAHDLGMAFLFAAVLAIGFAVKDKKFSLRWLDNLKPLGDMSYTLYVTHFPILVLAGGWLMARSPKGLLPQHFGWVFAGIAMAMLLAFALHFVVERPFLRRAVVSRSDGSFSV
jgi:peptidoglycan/LPS O-acetylase OafA/YrhL